MKSISINSHLLNFHLLNFHLLNSRLLNSHLLNFHLLVPRLLNSYLLNSRLLNSHLLKSPLLKSNILNSLPQKPHSRRDYYSITSNNLSGDCYSDNSITSNNLSGDCYSDNSITSNNSSGYYSIGPIIFLFIFTLILFFLSSCSFTGSVVSEPKEDPFLAVELYFCDLVSCDDLYASFLTANPGSECALYDAGSKIKTILETENVQVVTDAGRKKKWVGDNLHYAVNNNLMHNKFCVSGTKIITGSHNPTNTANQDNVLIITSSYLTENYRDEFDELWEGDTNSETLNQIVTNDGLKIENYFCPEDSCESQVLETIQSAKSNVIFMTFSFTSDQVGDLLIKKIGQGIKVKGIYDKGQRNEYDEFNKLESAGAVVKAYAGKAMLHHKVFIIDSSIVITGSANPSKNGYYNNDENIIIIHSPSIAQQFEDEYLRLSQMAK